MRWILTLFVVACGSKTPSPGAARILEADDATLADCTALENVEGTASNNAAAKQAAKEKAAALGATHIKWIVPCCTTVEARAFRCDVPE
jgi:hypothetical protein